MNKRFHILLILTSLTYLNCSSVSQKEITYKSPERDCEWCGAEDAPPISELSNKTTICSSDEPGEPLLVSGYIYLPDGKTPAENILVYVYHTNIEGIYPKRGNETDNSRRHGYLRGWMITDENGYYEFETIKPEPYPTRSEPAHIHYTLAGPDFYEYWLKSLLFEGDPLINEEEYNMDKRSGGSNRIITLDSKNNMLIGRRDLIINEELMQKF